MYSASPSYRQPELSKPRHIWPITTGSQSKSTGQSIKTEPSKPHLMWAPSLCSA
uniref:Uncharacterized protein n=1 Tax=Arundo donax TaxID=35708 RepID=A0A0A9EB31_ARUDO